MTPDVVVLGRVANQRFEDDIAPDVTEHGLEVLLKRRVRGCRLVLRERCD
jgi:hypothetical protein